MDHHSASLQCPACFKWFSTEHGRNTHLSQAQSCQWFKKGKLKDLADTDYEHSSISSADDERMDLDSDAEFGDDMRLDSFSRNDEAWLEDEDVEEDASSNYSLEGPRYHFRDEQRLLPPSLPATGPGPGPSTLANRPLRIAPGILNLDENDDERHTIVHPSAGLVKAHKAIAVHKGGLDNAFTPFSSFLDWKIAQWAIKDSIGHRSLDRLFAIPGVRHMFNEVEYLSNLTSGGR